MLIRLVDGNVTSLFLCPWVRTPFHFEVEREIKIMDFFIVLQNVLIFNSLFLNNYLEVIESLFIFAGEIIDFSA